ncbi:serine--tRNA ligase [Patescibacteria group bacterium]|nr:serine--tRNA ligase [Patescibacteria group bacterium]
MIDINLLRENSDLVKTALAKREVDLDIDKISTLDKSKRELLQIVEGLRAEKNKLSSGKIEDIKKAREVKNQLKIKEQELGIAEEEFNKLFSLIPNIPLDDVPEKEFEIIRQYGKPTDFGFKVKNHLEIGENLDLIDAERAAKISGSRFGILKNQAVLLEFALARFAMDNILKQGFIPVIPPVLLKEEMMRKMGYIDTKEDLEERYFFEKDNLFLAGTSEQMIGPMHADEILSDLPKRYLSFSTCFREEAGSYGKDTKGIFRVHQFDKLEMFSFAKAGDSKKELEFLLNIQEDLVKKLKLPYRVVHLPANDIARPSASTYDIETWIPSQEKYRETHSASNCTDFQARRLNIKYKEGSKADFVYTLNATAFAIGRMIIAILENYQQKDGSVKMPKALHKYLGFKVIKK